MANIDISSLQQFSASDLLIITNASIVKVELGAQAYGENGRQLTRADLDTLYARRAELMAEIAIAQDGQNGAGNVLVQYRRDS